MDGSEYMLSVAIQIPIEHPGMHYGKSQWISWLKASDIMLVILTSKFSEL